MDGQKTQNFSWSAPSDDGGCDITGYAIYLYEYKYLADGSVSPNPPKDRDGRREDSGRG